MLLGSLDQVDHTRISGWAHDPDAPGTPVELELIHNGRRLARLCANRLRADIAEAGIAGARCGFHLTIGGGWLAFERHEIAVRRVSDGVELPGSPVILGPSIDLDGHARDTVDHLLRDQAEGGAAAPAATVAMLVSTTWRLLLAAGPAKADMARAFRDRWSSLLPESAPTAIPNQPERPPDLPPRMLAIVPGRPDAQPSHGRLLGRIRAFRRLGYEVTLAAHQAAPADAASVGLEAEGIRCAVLPFDPSVEDVLRRNAGLFDAICVEGEMGFMQYGALARRYCPRASLIYGAGSPRSAFLGPQAGLEGRPELAVEAERARVGETVACLSADLVLADLDGDAALLRGMVPQARIRVVRWGIAARPYGDLPRAGIGFVGDWSDAAERDAGMVFIEAVLPAILGRHPDMPIVVAGSVPEPLRRHLPAGALRLHDVSDVLAQVRLTVMPRRLDASVSPAVLASLAAGVPFVGTAMAWGGVGMQAGAACETAEDLAAMCAWLHQDPLALSAARVTCANAMAGMFDAAANDALLLAALGVQARGKAGAPPLPASPLRPIAGDNRATG